MKEVIVKIGANNNGNRSLVAVLKFENGGRHIIENDEISFGNCGMTIEDIEIKISELGGSIESTKNNPTVKG